MAKSSLNDHLKTPVSSVELVEQVKVANQRQARLNRFAIAIAAVVIIVVLTFLSVFTIANTRQIRTIIETNHAINTAETNQELALINDDAKQTAANRDLLAQQDTYFLCLVSLFTNHTSISSTDLAACKPPFVQNPVPSTSGGSSGTNPKVSSTANNNSVPSNASNSSASSTGGSQTTTPTTPVVPVTPPTTENPVLKLITTPVNSLLNGLGL